MVFCLGTTWSNVSLYRNDLYRNYFVSKLLCIETTLYRNDREPLSLARLDFGQNYRNEPPEILFKCFKNFVYPCTQKKKGKFWTVFQNILFISQFMNCFIAARGKSRRIGQMNFNFFNKELVSSFFPVNLSGGQFFVTAEDRHLWNVSETLKEYTLPVIFSSLLQQRNRHC